MNSNLERKKPLDKVMSDVTDPRFYHLNKEDRIKVQFGLYHGKGKKKKKKK